MIRVHCLFKAFGRRELFGGLSLEVAAGERVALLGHSGAGKTTLLRLLAGLTLPDSGIVEIEGRNLSTLAEIDRARLRANRMGCVFQGDNVLPHLSVLQNVVLPGLFVERMVDMSRCEAALESVGLRGRGAQLGGTLSGGEQQRVAVARAVAQRPSILLCDEPTGNLDRSASERVGQLLMATAREVGCALILATHDLALASRCDRQITIEGSAP